MPSPGKFRMDVSDASMAGFLGQVALGIIRRSRLMSVGLRRTGYGVQPRANSRLRKLIRARRQQCADSTASEKFRVRRTQKELFCEAYKP